MSGKKLGGENPFDSLGILERELLSRNKLESYFNEYNLDVYNPYHKLAMNHLKFWHDDHHWNLIDNHKHKHCVKVKIEEILLCEESKNWGLDFTLVMNWDSPYSFDCFLRKGNYNYLVSDIKFQSNSYHISKPNPAGVHADNFLTLREDQLPEYCKNELPLVLIVKDVDYSLPNNRKVKMFAKKYNWPDEKMKCENEKRIVLVDTKTLCKMYYEGNGTIPLNVPKEHRGKHNGEWNGDTIGFSRYHFPSYKLG
jgi:hypothetical protein